MIGVIVLDGEAKVERGEVYPLVAVHIPRNYFDSSRRSGDDAGEECRFCSIDDIICGGSR